MKRGGKSRPPDLQPLPEPNAVLVSSPRGRRWGRMVTLGVPVLLLVLVLGKFVSEFARELQFYSRLRVTGPKLDSPDRVRVLSAAWVEKDLYRITVRLTRSDGEPMYSPHGIRLTDTAPGGYGEISDYVSHRITAAPAQDVVAYQRLPHAPTGPLTLRIDGFTTVPRVMEPEWIRFFLGPQPRRQRLVRYPLQGGEVTLPAPEGRGAGGFGED